MRVVVVLAILCRFAHAEPPGLSGTSDDDTPPVVPPATRAVGAPQPAPEPPPEQPPTPALAPYRAQTILADALAGTLMFIAFNSRDDERAQAFAKLSITTYIFGAPIVHLSKNRGRRALGSMTMRLGLPVLGAMLGSAVADRGACDGYYDSCGEDDWPNKEMGYGAVAGVLAASALDAIYLAKGEPAKPARAAWGPTAHATRGGFALGVAGNF